MQFRDNAAERTRAQAAAIRTLRYRSNSARVNTTREPIRAARMRLWLDSRSKVRTEILKYSAASARFIVAGGFVRVLKFATVGSVIACLVDGLNCRRLRPVGLRLGTRTLQLIN